MNTDFTPKYRMIQAYIIDLINNKTLNVGDRIPSEADISELFSVSRVTANTAIKELATMGIVNRIRGVGSFVAAKESASQNTNSMFFHEDTQVSVKNFSFGEKKHKGISFKIISADEHIQQQLHLKPQEKVLEVVRQVYLDNKADQLDYSYIPAETLHSAGIDVKGKEAETLLQDLDHLYFHEFLREKLNINCKYMRIFMRPVDEFYQEKVPIQTKAKEFLLLWDLILYDMEGRPVGLTTTLSKQTDGRAFLTFAL